MSDEGMENLTASDGHALEGYLAPAARESRGGLIILQEIFGVTDQLKEVAQSYAADGFDTIVPALYDRVEPQTVVPFDDPDGGRAVMRQLDNDQVMLDVKAARAHIDNGKGVSVLGFCWGGGMALLAATTLQLNGSVSYYGTQLPKFLEKGPNCPMLFHFGETDMMNTPPEVIEQIREAIPECESYVYAAGHAFANDARPTYVADAAVPARERSLAFLNKCHG